MRVLFVLALSLVGVLTTVQAQERERSYGDVEVSVKESDEKLTFTAQVFIPADKDAERKQGKEAATLARYRAALTYARAEIERRAKALEVAAAVLTPGDPAVASTENRATSNKYETEVRPAEK